MLSPFVYWAQTSNLISLKVDLRDVKSHHIEMDAGKLHFRALGIGAKGPHMYEFTLDLYLPIDVENSKYNVTERQVDLVLKKKHSTWWPRLQSHPQKPAWLKVDFDRWRPEDEADEESERRNVMDDYPNVYERLKAEEMFYQTEDMRKVLLTIYNVFQCVGYLYILIVMGIHYYRDGPGSFVKSYETVGGVMMCTQLVQFSEIGFTLGGYTKGGKWTTIMQVLGRFIVLFILIEQEERMHSKPVVGYLFVIWSLVEIVRYPYYITQIHHYESGLLTWLRYTIWIPLYPLGFLCEGIIILRDIIYFEETQKFSLALPNSWNVAFHLPSILRLYLILLFLPGMYTLMTQMYRARVKKLHVKTHSRVD